MCFHNFVIAYNITALIHFGKDSSVFLQSYDYVNMASLRKWDCEYEFHTWLICTG